MNKTESNVSETPPVRPSRWLPLLLAIAIFMQMLDATILNTALPEIAKDFKVSPLNMQLAAISYTLTVALLIPLSGYLVDRFGTKNVFFGSIGIFMLGSALCAAAANLPMLVMARVIQGIGGSMLVPVPRLTILRVYDKSQLLNAINYAVMPALIGPIFGPLVGGYLVEYASWHWIFLLNLPIGLLGVLLGWRIMPDVKGENTTLDLSGYLTFASAACLLMLAVEMVSHSGAVWFSLLLALGGTAFALLYYRHMKTAANPIYAADLFQVRTFRLGLTGNLFSRLGISSIPFLLPLLFQVAFGFAASVSGWLVARLACCQTAHQAPDVALRLPQRVDLEHAPPRHTDYAACPTRRRHVLKRLDSPAAPHRHLQLHPVFRHEHPDHCRPARTPNRQRQQHDGGQPTTRHQPRHCARRAYPAKLVAKQLHRRQPPPLIPPHPAFHRLDYTRLQYHIQPPAHFRRTQPNRLNISPNLKGRLKDIPRFYPHHPSVKATNGNSKNCI